MDFGTGIGVLFGLSLLLPVALLGIVVLGIVAVAGGREPDPTGQRQRTVYLGAVCFVALITLLFAAFGAASSVIGLLGDGDEVHTVGARGTGFLSDDEDTTFGGGDDEGSGFSFGEDDDNPIIVEDDGNRTEEAVSGMVAALTIALAAGAVYVFHRRLLDKQVAAPGFEGGPAQRAVNGYLYAVSFVGALVALGAAAAALYGVYRLALPDFSAPDGHDERMAGVRQLLSSAFLALAAAAMFQRHFNQAEAWTTPVTAPASDSDTDLPPIA